MRGQNLYNPAPDTTHTLQDNCVLNNDQMHALSITHPSIYVAPADGIEQTVDGEVVANLAPDNIYILKSRANQNGSQPPYAEPASQILGPGPKIIP